VPTAYLSPSQLKELTDVSVNPGVGQNGYPLVWNNTTGKWEASDYVNGVQIKVRGPDQNNINSVIIGGPSNPTGARNIVIGINAAPNLGTGNSNIIEGFLAGYALTTQVQNVFQGYLAGGSSAQNDNLYQGFSAGTSNTAGAGNLAQGTNAAGLNQTGSSWMAQGAGAAYDNVGGSYFIAQGINSARAAGSNGTGFLAQGYLAGNSNASAGYWTAQGFEAGFWETQANTLHIANDRSKSLICGLFDTNCIYFGHAGPITSTASVPRPTAAVHAAASNTTRASLRIDAGVAPTIPNTGDIWVNSSNNSLNFQLPLINLQGTQVLATRRTGWTAPTGTATRTTFATFAGQDISATPTEVEVQAIDDHVKVLSERLKALIDDLTTHGLIGT
jgi:hypothetical protein